MFSVRDRLFLISRSKQDICLDYTPFLNSLVKSLDKSSDQFNFLKGIFSL